MIFKLLNENLIQQALMLFEHEYVEETASEAQIPLYDFAEYINGSAFKPDELGDTGLPVIKIAELKSGIADSTRFLMDIRGISISLSTEISYSHGLEIPKHPSIFLSGIMVMEFLTNILLM